ncbi:hypothetical protein [Nonomuraea zeae]|uniref:hypothetical protein n=1 Tax=Nonomuraea zeae TaxID=1642303 RepID=UPI00147971AD|nr:hypothetical protein [Nonomuraea zeae]
MPDTPLEPLLAVQVWHKGGALAAFRSGAGPSGPWIEPYLLYLELSAATGDRQ